MDDSSDESKQPAKPERLATKKELDEAFVALHAMVLGQWEAITLLLEYLADRGKLSVPDLQRYLDEVLLSERAANLQGARLDALLELRGFLRTLPESAGGAPH